MFFQPLAQGIAEHGSNGRALGKSTSDRSGGQFAEGLGYYGGSRVGHGEILFVFETIALMGE